MTCKVCKTESLSLHCRYCGAYNLPGYAPINARGQLMARAHGAGLEIPATVERIVKAEQTRIRRAL